MLRDTRGTDRANMEVYADVIYLRLCLIHPDADNKDPFIEAASLVFETPAEYLDQIYKEGLETCGSEEHGDITDYVMGELKRQFPENPYWSIKPAFSL